jgi:RHS repeat-associated protein
LVNSAGSTPNNYLYRGEQFDPDLGLYYLRARYYNPVTGRFLTRDPEPGDPSEPTSLHKYVYARHSPVNWIDPTGRLVQTPPTQPQPTKVTGAANEYAAVIENVSLSRQTVTGLATLAAAITCLYEFDASAVQGIAEHAGETNITIRPGGFCSAKVTGEAPKPKPSCTQQHPDWPVNYLHLSSTPLIGTHVAAAQGAGWPDGLTYLGPNNPQGKNNRKAACPPGKYPGMSCDEYPYASTAQGGAGASTAPVPLSEQQSQGGTLSRFYMGLSAGQNFCVAVVQ